MRFETVDPSDPRAVAAIASYTDEVLARMGANPGNALAGSDGELFTSPAGLFLLALDDDEGVLGCGGLRFLEHGIAEIKRMWIAPEGRGCGLGRSLLSELERVAKRSGSSRVRLDTNDTLTEAIRLYEAAGYRRIERYNDNPDATRFYEHSLFTCA